MLLIWTSKINHRGEDRLKVEFTYNEAIANQVSQIKGAAWSRIHVAWHIPFTDEAIGELKRRFPDTGHRCFFEVYKAENKFGGYQLGRATVCLSVHYPNEVEFFLSEPSLPRWIKK